MPSYTRKKLNFAFEHKESDLRKICLSSLNICFFLYTPIQIFWEYLPTPAPPPAPGAEGRRFAFC